MRPVYKDFKFKGMRKPQSFIFYPCQPNDTSILIQSGQRIGRVNLETGKIYLSKGRSSGSYGHDLCEARGAKYIDLTSEDLALIKEGIKEMSGKTQKSGNSADDRTVTLLG